MALGVRPRRWAHPKGQPTHPTGIPKTKHRAEHGRPITRDALREGLNIGTNKATGLNRRLREHTARTARLAVREELVLADAPRDQDTELARNTVRDGRRSPKRASTSAPFDLVAQLPPRSYYISCLA